MKLSQFVKKSLTAIPQNIFLIIILLSIFAATSWSVLNPGLGVGHDLNHQARIFEMAQGLQDGAFPVIWSENLAYGYGMPLFEFYAPLPYLIGALFYMVGFNLQHSVEAMVLVPNILTVLGAYWLGKELFKNKWAGLLTSATISMAPYRAVDLFVRTAISEGWAIAFLVLTLLGIVQVVHQKKFGWLVFSTSFASLILSHNLTALMSLPFLVLFSLSYIFLSYKIWSERFTSVLQLFTAGLTGLGLTAFYFLPALIEKNFTQIDQYTLSSYYDFRQHFLYIRQFLEPWGVWEFGGSGWGPNDEMSFFLGFGQLIIFAVAALQVVYFTFQYKKIKENRTLLATQIVLLTLTAVSLILTLLKVQKIWEVFASFTAYFQFPWRFLAVTAVLGGLIAGSSYLFLNNKLKVIYFCAITVLLLSFNTRYFQSDKYEDHSADYSDYAHVVRNETSNNLYDYIPKDINFFEKRGFYLYKNASYTHLEAPATSLFSQTFEIAYSPQLIENTSTRKQFFFAAAEPTTITLNIAYYPGWQVMIDGSAAKAQASANGLIEFSVDSGTHTVIVELEDTPVRFWGKIVSVVTVLMVIGTVVLQLTSVKFKN
jgi:hypothetical protein